MASKFWQGFAGTMGGIMDERRMADAEMQKQRALKELEKEFGMEIVDPGLTTVEGNVEVRYNKYGTKISERPLSPEEIAARQADLDKTKADARRASIGADLDEKKFSTYDEDRQLALDEAASIREAREAGTAQGWARIGLDRERLSREDKDNADAVVAALSAVHGVGGVSSGEAMIQQFRRELASATDENERKMIIAEWKGTAQRLAGEQQFSRQKELRGGNMFQSLDPGAGR